MQRGFNADIVFKGMSFHVQSEDWGFDNPYLVSRVYQNGAVIKSIKTPYAEVLVRNEQRDAQAVGLALREQHQKILDLLVSGQLL